MIGRPASIVTERLSAKSRPATAWKWARFGEPLPAYAYVPGGPWPHPNRARRKGTRATSRHRARRLTLTLAIEPWFRAGVELFNAGYYWEAHEVWEGLWHAYGRRGADGRHLKALIKLAAAGVKVREGRRARRAHPLPPRRRAVRRGGREGGGPNWGSTSTLGQARRRRIAENPPRDPGPPGAPVSRVFAFRIELDRPQHSERMTDGRRDLKPALAQVPAPAGAERERQACRTMIRA